jgi:hypothetical protein
MSKRINVNPDHYKSKGRERQGHDLAKPPTAARILDRAGHERWARQLERQKSGASTRPRRTPPELEAKRGEE